MSGHAARADGATNIVLVGVGGQGTLLAADVVAMVGLELGLDVKKSEVHGMAQRGGSVVSEVRWGRQVRSPLIEPGEVDLLVAFERLEALRYADLLRRDGALLVSDYRIVPISVTSGNDVYPDAAAEEAAFDGRIARRHLIPAIEIARSLGQPRVSNVVMLGALSALMDVDEGVWLDVVSRRVPQRYVEMNRQAFRLGRDHLAGRG